MHDNAELQYFYFGFYRVLKRYRTTSVCGWLIVFAGCLSAPLGWNLGGSTGLIDVVLTALTILAGLVVVWQNISALNEYIRVPFPSDAIGEVNLKNEVISEIRTLMKDVDEGGWQEAYAAIGQLIKIQTKYSLPKLD